MHAFFHFQSTTKRKFPFWLSPPTWSHLKISQNNAKLYPKQTYRNSCSLMLAAFSSCCYWFSLIEGRGRQIYSACAKIVYCFFFLFSFTFGAKLKPISVWGKWYRVWIPFRCICDENLLLNRLVGIILFLLCTMASPNVVSLKIIKSDRK